LDPEQHLRLGEALRAGRRQGAFHWLGFFFPQLQAFSWSPEAAPDPANDDFQDG
jgi:uncharacterized protein (DUF1810 family)